MTQEPTRRAAWFAVPLAIYAASRVGQVALVAWLIPRDGGSVTDRLMLWIGSPSTTTADESSGAKLNLSDEAAADEEGDQPDDNGSVDALVKELKGQRWDADKSVWE